MVPAESELLGLLARMKGSMLSLLERLVEIDSPSRHAQGVNRVSAVMEEFLTGHGVAVTRIGNDTYGDALRAVVAGIGSAAPIVLLGHCDTVFPAGEAQRRPFRTNGTRAYGPGVADMKGGLVMNAHLLAALHKLGAERTVVGLFTVDEEIASPWSRTVIQQTCLGSLAVLNSEPGRANGNIVVARKGGMFFRIEIAGKAAHSGIAFASGISAVDEAAHKILALSSITDARRDITANAGVVSGGSTFNTVAASAFIDAEVRYRHLEDRDRVRQMIEDIACRSFVPGSTGKLIVHGEFSPMEQHARAVRLFGIYRAAAAELGLAIEGEFSGGCSDAGFATTGGIPALCAVGPIGGNTHTTDEYLEIDSLVPRAQALALTIARFTA